MSSETPAFLFHPPKKKGRRPKSYYENLKLLEATDNSNNLIIYADKKSEDAEIPEPKIHKKRGRKPKGGKVVEVKNILVNNIPVPNIILHLSCKLQDIEDVNNTLDKAIKSYKESSDLITYTKKIKQNWPIEKRIEVIEMLWKVCLVDGVLEPYEDMLIRRVSGLIYVDDKDRNIAKKNAIKKLNDYK